MSRLIGTILVADDDPAILKLLSRTLSSIGYEVKTAETGKQAVEWSRQVAFDVIVSDIDMPGVTGIDLLKAVRANDPDVPVILITGEPHVQTAMRAVRYGAFRYLSKPIDMEELSESLAFAMQVHQLARIKREAMALLGDNDRRAADLAGLERDFDCALKSLWMAFQPIVSYSSKKVIGYEALMRSVEPALPHPGAILDAAERLTRLRDLGERTRDAVAAEIGALPDGVQCFVNLHPQDLIDETLFSRVAPLSAHSKKVVLEITERVDLDHIGDVEKRIAALREMGFRLAVDDLGAGYAGLTSFVRLKPEIVKIDMSLVRDIHLDPAKRKLVASMIDLCDSMGIQSVMEGVETVDEMRTLVAIGADLMQGFHFAAPAVPFCDVAPELFEFEDNEDAEPAGEPKSAAG